MTSMEIVLYWVSTSFLLIGIFFMIECKVVWLINISTNDAFKGVSPHPYMCALVSHYVFLMGLLLFSIGMCGFCFALQLSKSLSIVVALISPLSVHFIAQIRRKGPTAIPNATF